MRRSSLILSVIDFIWIFLHLASYERNYIDYWLTLLNYIDYWFILLSFAMLISRYYIDLAKLYSSPFPNPNPKEKIWVGVGVFRTREQRWCQPIPNPQNDRSGRVNLRVTRVDPFSKEFIFPHVFAFFFGFLSLYYYVRN